MYAADTGSFTKAAERLNYTPSGVSQLVGALENETGLLRYGFAMNVPIMQYEIC
ncbi:helix-turn-helix domain-containing protein [Coprococcus comes]|uniref:helix-turn-helix domain-containing protein n=1 Tax=Coprococcus comes TaxID=410072 RepID=UPI002FE6CF24